MSACSERCGHCGRCTRVGGSRRAEPCRADFTAIHHGFTAVGLDRDYFGVDDILYLWKQGKGPAEIVSIAREHADRAAKLQKKGA